MSSLPPREPHDVSSPSRAEWSSLTCRSSRCLASHHCWCHLPAGRLVSYRHPSRILHHHSIGRLCFHTSHNPPTTPCMPLALPRRRAPIRLVPPHFPCRPAAHPQIDPHKLSQRANIQQATHKVNRFAKRDPALYPLSFIVVGAFAVAGYFLCVGSASQIP